MEGSSFGQYQLLNLLGQGGMGQVFRAYDATTDRVVALKVLPSHLAEDQVFQQRFRREARIAASLNDPHVVPIHGYGEIDGRLYVDMRLIEGRDLGRYIAENGGRLSPERAVAVIEQVAAALDSAHQVGLIHRDIKPSNILVTVARDFVYLIDFGIARTAADTALTNTGHTMGTVGYMAPERFRGTTDHRGDVYSLACVLYECLTGRRPYAGDSLEEQLNAHLNAPPPQPSTIAPDVPAAFDAVIARGLAKDPEQRYQSAIELAEAARAALAGPRPKPDLSPPASGYPQQPPAKTFNRRLLLGIVGASVVALAAVIALVIAVVTQSHRPTSSTASTTPAHARAPRGTATTAATIPPLPAFAPPRASAPTANTPRRRIRPANPSTRLRRARSPPTRLRSTPPSRPTSATLASSSPTPSPHAR